MKVYLDNAATTPVAPEVLDAMLPYFCEKFGNPSSIHQFGRETKAAIERARKKIANYFNTSPSEIFFTSGGTESANFVIGGAVRTLGVKRIITSKIEHHCTLHTIDALEKNQLARAEFVELDEKGNIDLAHLEKLLAEKNEKTLVCLMHANNEIGNITDIQKVGEMVAATGVLFFSDTVQTVGHYKIDLQQTKVHFISGSAHKFHGPKGVGFVYMKKAAMLRPLLYGGSQERNLRAGTENLTGIVGMEKALELCYENLEKEQQQILSLKNYFLEKLKASIPDVHLNGNENENSLYTVLNISFPASERASFLVYNLDIENIAASAGSACSSGSEAGSHVLQAINADPQRSSVRFSFSRYNTKEELDLVMEKLKELV